MRESIVNFYSQFKYDQQTKLRVAGFEKESVVDGPGLRYTIFVQGCLGNCKGCHNPETHDLTEGVLVDIDDIYNDIREHKIVRGVTFSGGEPMLQPAAITELAKRLKSDGYDLWCYTGYLMEDLVRHPNQYGELFKSLDVIVDGPFIEAEKSMDVLFRGSKNQRLIDVQLTLKLGHVALFHELTQ